MSQDLRLHFNSHLLIIPTVHGFHFGSKSVCDRLPVTFSSNFLTQAKSVYLCIPQAGRQSAKTHRCGESRTTRVKTVGGDVSRYESAIHFRRWGPHIRKISNPITTIIWVVDRVPIRGRKQKVDWLWSSQWYSDLEGRPPIRWVEGHLLKHPKPLT